MTNQTLSRSSRLGPLFLFLSALFWSLNGIFTKSVSWGSMSLACVRGVMALLITALVLRRVRFSLNRAKVMTAICYFAQGILFVVANKFTTAANATVLQNTSPLYIILLNALILKKLPTKRDVVTCICLFAGVSLAFAGNMQGGGMLGNISALVSALFYAGVFFFSKQEGANPLESIVLGNVLYLFLLPFLFSDPAVAASTPSTWAFVVFFATLCGAVAWLCFSRGIRTTPALQANFITMLEPIMSPLWTFLFLREQISPLSLIGCGAVLATLIVYNALEVKKPLPPQPAKAVSSE